MDDTFFSLLRGATQCGASDIHIKPGRPIIFRISRRLAPVEMPAPDTQWVRSLVRWLAPDNVAVEGVHEVDFATSVEGIGRVRVNVFTQRGEPAIAMRLVKDVVPGFADLNLPPVVQRLALQPRGIVIVAGAIGSGKSTTMAAMIESMNRTERRHIIMLEDPIEFLFHDNQCVIEQREIGPDTESYAKGLRNILRQDPDVIVIGEMRDAVSARAAMSAANVGHLVLTTLHTTDAPRSIQRMLEFFPQDERDYARRLLASTLAGVVCQRLIKTKDHHVIPAVEVLISNSGVVQAIESQKLEKLTGIMELGATESMQTFDQALYALAQNKKISREEALAHATNPDNLRMLFQGVVVSDNRRILGER